MELQAYLLKPGLKIILSNEIGRITKQILDQINSKLCEILKVKEMKEWKNERTLQALLIGLKKWMEKFTHISNSTHPSKNNRGLKICEATCDNKIQRYRNNLSR